jgi:hypothetical protein
MPVRPDSARRPLRRVAGPNAETRIWGREAGVGRCGGGAVVLNTIAHSYARLDPPSVRGPGATPRLVREGVQGWWAERDGTARGRRPTKFECESAPGWLGRTPPLFTTSHVIASARNPPDRFGRKTPTRKLTAPNSCFERQRLKIHMSHCHLPHTFLTYHSLNFER